MSWVFSALVSLPSSAHHEDGLWRVLWQVPNSKKQIEFIVADPEAAAAFYANEQEVRKHKLFALARFVRGRLDPSLPWKTVQIYAKKSDRSSVRWDLAMRVAPELWSNLAFDFVWPEILRQMLVGENSRDLHSFGVLLPRINEKGLHFAFVEGMLSTLQFQLDGFKTESGELSRTTIILQAPTAKVAEKLAKVVQDLTGAAPVEPLELDVETQGIWMLPGFEEQVEIVNAFPEIASTSSIEQIVKRRWQQCVDLYGERFEDPVSVVEVRAIKRALGRLTDEGQRFMGRYFGRMHLDLTHNRYDRNSDLIAKVMRTLVRFPRRGPGGCESAMKPKD